MAAAPQPPTFRADHVPGDGEPDVRVSNDERLWATGSHALSFIEGGILGPLVVYLVKKETSPFVAFHALQSLYFGLAVLVATLVTFITIIGPLVIVVVYWVYEIMACVKAYNGEWYRLPFVGDWALRSHPIPALWPPPPASTAQPPGPSPRTPPEEDRRTEG
jgi:hypothetical protein